MHRSGNAIRATTPVVTGDAEARTAFNVASDDLATHPGDPGVSVYDPKYRVPAMS